ncbi:MAG: hypothetical protein ABIH88_01115, partial [Patescibacteria group bacterium]
MTLKSLLTCLEKKHKAILGITFLGGVFLLWLTMARSGLVYDFGMGFWGPNGHDGIWHLALARQIFNGFPPPHPLMSGEVLTNYHYFYDFLLSAVNKVTNIPFETLYFQIFPFLLVFFLGGLSFLVG